MERGVILEGMYIGETRLENMRCNSDDVNIDGEIGGRLKVNISDERVDGFNVIKDGKNRDGH